MTDPANTTVSRFEACFPVLHCIAILVAILLLLESAAPRIWAEENDSKASPPAAGNVQNPPRPNGPIQYIGPDTYILLDSDGRPQPVPGMTYEDFLKAWKKLNEPATAESQPHFTVERIRVDARAQGQRAELKFEANVHVLADGSIDVPLGLVGAILQGEPRLSQQDQPPQPAAKDQPASKSSTRDEYLDFDPQQGGFVAHLNGRAGEQRLLSLDLIVPLTRDGAETTLALNLPRAVSSSLALDIDSPISEARANNGAVVKKEPSPHGGTRIDVAGATGQFRLTWQGANKDGVGVASVLNAVGAIHVTIDGRGVRSDARLTVQSFGGTFDQFRVRLPRGAKLIRDPSVAANQEPKYRMSEEPTAPAARSEQPAGQVVLVELKEKQQGPVVIDLSTEQPGHDTTQAIELGGFEVLGAVRQFGDIGLNVAADWQARWNIGSNVRQVDPTEIDRSLQRSDLTAAFQYDRQPWSLGVHVSPRQSRVHVTPLYELEVLPEEARLTVRLAYQNFGARAFEFRVETAGWEMTGEPVESGGLVDQDRVTVTPKGILILPLAQATRKTEVAFSLRRALDRAASRLQLPLPVPLADSVATGQLTVRVPAEVELLPDLMSSGGLTAAPAREANGAADSQGVELHFRTLLPNAVFAATRSNRKREESTQITTRVEVGGDFLEVDERVEYAVLYEPLTEFLLEAPYELPLDDEELEIALLSAATGASETGERRTPLRFEAAVDEGEFLSTDSRRVHVVLPQPRIGKFTVSIRYRVARLQPASNRQTIDVPLLAPVDARFESQRATISTPRGLHVSLGSIADASSWKPVASPQRKASAAGAEFEFATDRSELSLPLVMGTADSSAPSATVVDRVWLQTWLSSGNAQDRAAFRLRTSSPQTTVELPPEAPPSDVEVLVDGRPADVAARAAGRIVVRLPRDPANAADTSEQATHTLEVRFRRPVQPALVARHGVTPPRIDGSTELSQIYWQIILPGDEHIVQSPEQLVSASQWQWLGSFWGRRPIKSQAELEEWVGATPQQAPTDADNQYLYTGLLPVSSIAFVTTPRWLIVLLASAATLVLFTGLFYLPMATRPWMLIALVVIIAAAAIAYPSAALLIAQAAAIGVLLAALSAIISRIVARPARRAVAPAAAPSTRAGTPRADSIVIPSVMAAASTAPTVTLRASDSER
jgi:hypothetical protein